MVIGMDSFLEKFSDYSDCYTIIGGTACEILMSEADTDFRATKDIDMILIMEARYKEFVKKFWEYVKDGGYRFGWKNSEKVHFYRFTDPKPGYPFMLNESIAFSFYYLPTFILTGPTLLYLKVSLLVLLFPCLNFLGRYRDTGLIAKPVIDKHIRVIKGI